MKTYIKQVLIHQPHTPTLSTPQKITEQSNPLLISQVVSLPSIFHPVLRNKPADSYHNLYSRSFFNPSADAQKYRAPIKARARGVLLELVYLYTYYILASRNWRARALGADVPALKACADLKIARRPHALGNQFSAAGMHKKSRAWCPAQEKERKRDAPRECIGRGCERDLVLACDHCRVIGPAIWAIRVFRGGCCTWDFIE